MPKKDILAYPGWMYSMGISQGKLSMEEARIEYMRIYKALRSRQRRMQQSEFAGSKFARMKLKPLSSIKTESQFVESLQSLAAMARGRQTSITGLREFRKDIAAALDVYGETGKSFQDFSAAEWTEFGAYMRRVHKASFDSERAVRLFRLAKSGGMTGASLYRDFHYWSQHEDDLKDFADEGRPLGSRVSSERIRNYLSKK